jgi:hypothetical protein
VEAAAWLGPMLRCRARVRNGFGFFGSVYIWKDSVVGPDLTPVDSLQ